MKMPTARPLEDVIAVHRCIGDDGTMLTVVEYRYRLQRSTRAGERAYPGSRRWALASGEPVRVVDSGMFEVLSTGEWLTLLGAER